MLWSVTRVLKQGCSYSYTKHYTCRFKVPASWTPKVLLSFCWMLASLLSKQLLFFFCFFSFLVIAWYVDEISHTPNPREKLKHVLHRVIHLLLVTSSSPRGSPQCIAFKRYCTRQHLTAVQRNVCHAKRCFLYDISSHLCKRVCSGI